jgi:hypothetical protein
MNYKELHLEAIMIPANIDELLAGESIWDIEVPPFSISIVETVYKGVDTMTWSIEFSPSFDFDDLNKKIEEKGFEPDGYGWTEYIQEYITTHYPKAKDRIREDSESGTCCLYTFTKSDFTALLKIVSESIRELY